MSSPQRHLLQQRTFSHAKVSALGGIKNPVIPEPSQLANEYLAHGANSSAASACVTASTNASRSYRDDGCEAPKTAGNQSAEKK